VSYLAAIENLRSTIAAIPGISVVRVGFPSSVQRTPLVYLEADSGDRNAAGQLTANTYRIIASLCVPMQDNTAAESQIAPFINSLPAAIDINATLDGACNIAKVTGWRTDVRPIGGQSGEAANMYRIVDFTVSILDKGAYRGGI
jgi:hypothetical protein